MSHFISLFALGLGILLSPWYSALGWRQVVEKLDVLWKSRQLQTLEQRIYYKAGHRNPVIVFPIDIWAWHSHPTETCSFSPPTLPHPAFPLPQHDPARQKANCFLVLQMSPRLSPACSSQERTEFSLSSLFSQHILLNLSLSAPRALPLSISLGNLWTEYK